MGECLCAPLALLYNARGLSDKAASAGSSYAAALLQQAVNSVGRRMQPEQLLELLTRTDSSVAIVDRGKGMLVIIGMEGATRNRISLWLLESEHHVRSYFEATGQVGRTVGLHELVEFAQKEQLNITHHDDGLNWLLRPLGGDDTGTPTVKISALSTPTSRLRRPIPRPASRGAALATDLTLVGGALCASGRTVGSTSPSTSLGPGRGWVVNLTLSTPLAEAELYAELHLPGGLTPEQTLETFRTKLRMPDEAGNQMTLEERVQVAPVRAALLVLLTDKLIRQMAAKLVRKSSEPEITRDVTRKLKVGETRCLFRRFLFRTRTERLIKLVKKPVKRQLAERLADTLTLISNSMALNDSRRLEVLLGQMSGYTPMQGDPAPPVSVVIATGRRVKLKHWLPVRRAKVTPAVSLASKTNVQEVSSEDEVHVTAPWLVHAEEQLRASEALRRQTEAAAAAEAEAFSEGLASKVEERLRASEAQQHRSEAEAAAEAEAFAEELASKVDIVRTEANAQVTEARSAASQEYANAMAGISFLKDKVGAMSVDVCAAIDAMGQRQAEQGASVASLRLSLDTFGEGLEARLKVQVSAGIETAVGQFTTRLDAQQAEARQCTARVDAQQAANKADLEALAVELRGRISQVLQNDVPSFVGAVVTRASMSANAGSTKPRNGGGRAESEFGDKMVRCPSENRTFCGSSELESPKEHLYLGYCVFDATKGELESQSKLTLPHTLLQHIIATVVTSGTPETFQAAILDSVKIIPTTEPLNSPRAGNLVRETLQYLVGSEELQEDNVSVRVVDTPEGWVTANGIVPRFLVFVLRDFTGNPDIELARVIMSEAELEAKFMADTSAVQTMLLRSEPWVGDGHPVRTQLLLLFAALSPGAVNDRGPGVRSYSSGKPSSYPPAYSKLPKLTDSAANQVYANMKEWKEDCPSVQSYHYAVVKQSIEGLGTVIPFLARLKDGLEVFQAAVTTRMTNSAYGGTMSARLTDIANREDLAKRLHSLEKVLQLKAPNLPSDAPTANELSEFADVCKSILNNIRAACFGRKPIEQGRYEAQQLCNRRPDSTLFPTELHWLVTSVRGCLKLLDLVGRSLLPTIVGSDLSNFLGNMHEGCTTGEMKRRILSLADDFIAGSHEALNIQAVAAGKPTVPLHAYVAGLRSKAYGSMGHTSLDEELLLALAEPAGDFHDGVRVEKSHFHTSWDLKIINTVDMRAFLLVVERNIIQPSPGSAGIGLLGPASAGTLFVGGHHSDPLSVCCSGNAPSQLLVVEDEPPSEVEELRTTISKGLSEVAEKHGQHHTENLQTINATYQKIREETQLSLAEALTAQRKALEDRLAEFKYTQAESSSAFVDGQRHELAAQSKLYQTQLDNVAAHTELGKSRHAGGGALQSTSAPTYRHQPPTWTTAGRAECGTPAHQCGYGDHGHRVLAVQSQPAQARFQPSCGARAATGPDNRRNATSGTRGPQGTDSRNAKGMRLPGVRPRQVRRDESGNIIERYTDKPPTPWGDLPAHVQAPYLASQGFDEANWPERSKQPCGICGSHGETDHSWNHCLYLWACTDKGKAFFGEAKASERAQALLEHGVRSVRDMRQQFTAFISDEMGESAGETYEASVCAVQHAAELGDDDLADEFFELAYDATSFAQRLGELCAQVGRD